MAARKYTSVSHYIITGLVPYTEANLKLVFKPSEFFKEIAQLQKVQPGSVKNSYHRLVKKGFIEIDDMGVPRLTKAGVKNTRRFSGQKLKGSQLMVIFDIPEADRWKRRKLRTLLRELSFRQVQKSVWASEFDHRAYLRAEIADLNLSDSVKIFESRPLN